MTFEKQLEVCIRELKERFKFNNINYMRVDIDISGRVDGELIINFKVGENYGTAATAGSLEAAADEFFRRTKWAHRNNPLCLPNVPEAEETPT